MTRQSKGLILFVLLWILPFSELLACPSCAGSLSNPKDTYIAYILAGFVFLTAIPFTILYRVILKEGQRDAPDDPPPVSHKE